ncbi:MAG: hypothetical protein P8P16_04245, partial [Amylibacter sp.]|nr:hypothetical protein [Amylibacter sp.]
DIVKAIVKLAISFQFLFSSKVKKRALKSRVYIPVLEISYEIRVCVLKLIRALWFKITLREAQFFLGGGILGWHGRTFVARIPR